MEFNYPLFPVCRWLRCTRIPKRYKIQWVPPTPTFFQLAAPRSRCEKHIVKYIFCRATVLFQILYKLHSSVSVSARRKAITRSQQQQVPRRNQRLYIKTQVIPLSKDWMFLKHSHPPPFITFKNSFCLFCLFQIHFC